MASRRSTDAPSEPALESARLCRTIDTSLARSSPRLPASSQTRVLYRSSRPCMRRSAAGRNNGQDRRLARPAFADVRARSLEEHDRVSCHPIRQSASSSAASPPCGVAVRSITWRDSHGNGVHGRAPIGSRCYGVRFVDDDRVPGDVLERPQHFRPLHEIVRGDVDPGKRPGVHVRGPLRGHRSQPRGVGQERAAA